jgi:4-hydroxy-3-methylbut-2-enyl diphosphate reductase
VSRNSAGGRIILAEHAGFCAGVRRAVNIAERAGQAGGAVTLGALVHNPDVVGRLERAGVKVVHELEEAAGRTVIVPSHGLPPQTIRSAEAMGLTLVDATCPHVLKAQLAAARAAEAGRTVVIVGDAEHPEVKAVAAHAGDHVHVVDGPAALDEIGIREGQPVTVLAQTTQVASLVEAVVEKARHMGVDVEHVNTVCPATAERQRAAADLATKVDLMVVIGGKASANTMRLAEVCRGKGVPVLKVERSSELDASALRGARLIGVTAGASTPSWVMEEVMDAMSEIIEGNQENVQEVVSVTPPAHEAPPEPEILKARVEEVYDDRIIVHLETEETATVFLKELTREAVTAASEVVSVGDEIFVVPDRRRKVAGADELVASKIQADTLLLWRKLAEAQETGEIIESTVTQVVKGGLVVDVRMPGLDEKARGFVPASQVGRRFVEDLGQFVGQTLRLKVREVEPARSNVVLSHRAVLEEEEKKARAEAFATLQKGQVLDGKVTRLVTFGAFVDIGKGVEGLLHISDISWSRIKHPSEVLSEGQEIKVVVLNVDTERERISLGYKQLQPDPWDNIAQRFPEGTITKGVVTKLMDFGAFVSIADGVEGLVHISQLSDRRISRPDEVVQVGDEITVKVIGIKPQEHRISLSARQVLEEGERNEYRKYMKDQKADETVTIGDRLGYDLRKQVQYDSDDEQGN